MPNADPGQIAEVHRRGSEIHERVFGMRLIGENIDRNAPMLRDYLEINLRSTDGGWPKHRRKARVKCAGSL
jgi:hypothetical protein